MTLQEKLIGGIQWDAKSDMELVLRIERIAITLRKKRLVLDTLWEQAVTRNCFAACIAWDRMRKLLPSEDAEVAALRAALEEFISAEGDRWEAVYNTFDYHDSDVEDPDEWHIQLGAPENHRLTAENVLLAKLFLNRMKNIYMFFRVYRSDSARANILAKRMENVNRMPWMCARLLYASLRGCGTSSRDVQMALCNKYVFRGTKYEEDFFLQAFCQDAAELNRVIDLRNVLRLFPDIHLLRLCQRSKEDFLEMAKSFSVPTAGIRFYYDFLVSEGWSGQELLDEVGKLCTFSVCPSACALNDYLHLCWRLQAYPAEAEQILWETDLPEIPEDVHIPSRTMAIFLNETLYALLQAHSDRLLHFSYRMGKANPFLYREKMVFKKNQVWYDGAGRYLVVYKKSIRELPAIYTKQEIVDLYMNSSLKSLVDFHYLIKCLFKEEFQAIDSDPYIDLRPFLGTYLFVGKMHYNHHNYRVSVSSVNSSYRFPVHINWSRNHEDYIRNYLPDGIPVSFRITHADKRHGMIFAADVQNLADPLVGMYQVSQNDQTTE